MDVEETIKFLLENQARMAEHQQRMDGHLERLAEHHQHMDAHQRQSDAQFQSVADFLERVARAQTELVERESRRDEAISGLVVIVQELGANVDGLASQHRELEQSTTQRFRETDEKIKEMTATLHVLIKTVDDLIRRRNGGADPPKP